MYFTSINVDFFNFNGAANVMHGLQEKILFYQQQKEIADCGRAGFCD